MPFRAFMYSFRVQFLYAVTADILAAVTDQAPVGTAEDAGRFVLLQHDPVVFHEDLQLVPLRNIQSPAQLNGQNDPSQIVDLANNSSRLHVWLPLRIY